MKLYEDLLAENNKTTTECNDAIAKLADYTKLETKIQMLEKDILTKADLIEEYSIKVSSMETEISDKNKYINDLKILLESVKHCSTK